MRYILLLLLTFSFQGVQSQCMEDCVWPGDLNANGIANNLDVLAIGFTNGFTGPMRINTSTLWEPLTSENWAETLPVLGTNAKHIDSNGDGVIDEFDRIPISINYNQTNDNFTGLLGDDILGDDLFMVPIDGIATPSGSLNFEVHLGTAANPINEIYGIGFQLGIDTQYVEAVNVDFSDSWIGQDEEILTYEKFNGEIDHTGIAITRLDGIPVSGSGAIARVEIVITDVVLGLMVDTTACLPFQIEFKNVLGINEEGNDLMITNRNDSLALKHPSQLTNTEELGIADAAYQVFPNPASEQLTIENKKGTSTHYILYNQLGVMVYQRTSFDSITTIPIEDFPKGIYFLAIQSDRQKSIVKILRQ